MGRRQLRAAPTEKINFADLYGCEYFEPGAKQTREARSSDLYHYTMYAGAQEVAVEKGDTVFVIDGNRVEAFQGPRTVNSEVLATVIRGYRSPEKTAVLNFGSVVPYVNGCSTRQIFPPERDGDPTLQYLHIPPYTKEQEHHVHSTVRVVFIFEGHGRSIVGLGDKIHTESLYPGKIVLLHRFSPHHFETDESHLVCIPLHIFSSTDGEFHHPMFMGTHRL